MDQDYDAIIVGAGAAGLCCAGEMVLQGKRPLVICETKEVANTFRSVWLDERNRGTMQALAWQSGWGGGWWYPLARALNLNVKFREYDPMEAMTLGSGKRASLPYMTSASAFAEVISQMLPTPLSEAELQEVDSAVGAALRLPPEEVFAMDRVLLHDWLMDHGAGPNTAALLSSFCGRPNALTLEESVAHLSVACGLWSLRLMFFHEGSMCEMMPDPRDGLWFPLAQEIEARGGEIWRGRKVERVLVEDGRAVGVRLVDGQEVRGPAIAMANSNARIARTFETVPPELRAALDYAGPTPQRQLAVFFLLNRPVMDYPASLSISWPDGRRLAAVVPSHHTNVEPGKQVLHMLVANIGERTVEDVLEETQEGLAQAFPGFREAVEIVKSAVHTSEHWMDYITVGPKLPRRSPSLGGLWYVGQGVAPIVGFWTEAAAGSGVMGAREILADSPPRALGANVAG